MMVSNQIDDALAYISSETSRDEWLKILMAIKSELHECGYDIAKNWSQKSDMFNRNDFDSTWKSIKLEGGITIATLFKIAKDYGYAPDSNISCVKSNDASSVVGIWNSASIDNIELHNYLKVKQVDAHGIKVSMDGNLLVPIRKDQQLISLQIIKPNSQKQYLKDYPKKGGYH